jgi:hypothetical protein
MIQLYDTTSIDSLDWPDTQDAQLIKKWWSPLIKKGTAHFINNIDAQPFLIKTSNLILPVIVTNENYTNSWVCSPFAHYISYAKESVGLVGNQALGKILKGFLNAYGKVGKWSRMNSVIYINNWMFSTDLYPEKVDSAALDKIVDFLVKRYPKHIIMFRSLNALTAKPWMDELKKSTFSLLPSRYVFVSDGKNESIFKTRIVKSDLKLFRETSYQISYEVSHQECERLLELYLKLYVIDHSPLQPQFTSSYIKHLFEEGLIHFITIRQDGIIKGVAGYYKKSDVMMCPIFGYEKNNTESNTIYRLLNTALLNAAQAQGLLFNQSAGAAFFKSTRRAEGCLEYTALYKKHLPWHQKCFWSTLEFMMNILGPKFMDKY